MKLPFLAALAISLPLLASAAPAASAIFDGRSLAGWEGSAERWRVADGAITGEIAAGPTSPGHEGLIWNSEVHDFELEFELRWSGAAGVLPGAVVQFRIRTPQSGPATGYEAVLDGRGSRLARLAYGPGWAVQVERGQRLSIAPDGRKWSDPWVKVEDAPRPASAGAWIACRLVARGPRLELWVNGGLSCTLDDHQSDAAVNSGGLALQVNAAAGPARAQFRNLRLTPLGRTALLPAAPLPPLTAEVQSVKPVKADGQPLNLDFETGTRAGWTAEGDAWDRQPMSRADLAPPGGQVIGNEGKYWIGWHPQTGDSGTGRLSSEPFPVTHRWAGFLVGGGSDRSVRVEVVNATTGAVIHSASGANVEMMRREVVDLGEARQIFVRLVDEARGSWGHVRFDDFVFYAERPAFQAVHGGDVARPTQSPVLWHLRPNPAPPSPVANAAAQKLVAGLRLTPGFQAELIAAEPDLHQPIAFAIDERGRLWVVEAHTYPTKQPAGQGKDRVVILEDRDGDGRFETRKVFVEGLNLVSGIEVGFGGVWIGAAPELLFVPDANHDDVPDGPPRVLLDGWGFQDTHETLNSFTWGPDGWLYGNQGVFVTSRIGSPGTPLADRKELRAGVWRYHPVRHAFEVFCHGGSNQWGIDFNEHGHLFLTHCRSLHGGGGTTFAIRNGYFWNQANSNYPEFISNVAPPFAPGLKNFLPAAARYDSGEGGAGLPGTTAVYGGHSHAGTMIYLGDNWPEIYRNHLFTHNLHGHQLNHQMNVRTGSAYETFHAGSDLLYAPDPSYIAVDLQTGPDGAVYVNDWTDLQHCHTPHEEKWERGNGRMYRVSWAQTYKPVQVDLGRMADVELAALHTHRNEWFVRTARRLLQDRAARGTVDPAATAALRQQVKVAGEDATAALRALWTLHATAMLDATEISAMLQHSADVVRSWGVQLGTERSSAGQLSAGQLTALAQADPSAIVRLSVASAMPLLAPEARWTVAEALARHGEDAADRFLPRMIWFGLAGLVRQDVDRAMAIAAFTSLPTLADSIRWYVARMPRGRELIAARLANIPAADAARELQLLAFSVQNEARLPMPAGWSDVSQRFASSPDQTVRRVTEQLSAVWGDPAVLAQLRARLANNTLPTTERKSAFDALKRAADREALPIYVPLLDDTAFRSAVIPLLSGTDDPAAAAGILRHFRGLGDADKLAALNTLTSRPASALALLDAVEAGSFEKKSLTALHLRQMRNLADAGVNQRLDHVWGRVGDSSAEAKQTIARIKQAYEAAPLWAYSAKAGEDIFTRACVACHARNGQGGNLGPDLAGTWRNGVDYFLENIVDPNAVVGTDFQLNIVTKTDGTVVSGMVEKESGTALVLRTTSETVNVPLASVRSRVVSAQSLMPSGLLENLTERETIELLKFLTTRN